VLNATCWLSLKLQNSRVGEMHINYGHGCKCLNDEINQLVIMHLKCFLEREELFLCTPLQIKVGVCHEQGGGGEEDMAGKTGVRTPP